jgi:glutamine amidotransferase
METIGVIDYGMGNLHSLAKSLERVAGDRRVEISSDVAQLSKYDKLVLPGVGGVRGCMEELKRLELVDFLRAAARRVPLLGVCLGMQVLLDHSEENGGVPALGLIPGDVIRFPDPLPEPGTERLKVPHMGWNRVKQSRPHPLWAGIDDDSWYYFVHSFHAAPQNAAHRLGETEYSHSFAAAVARDNIVGVQFHPEKSQGAGLRLLANFAAWNGELA